MVIVDEELGGELYGIVHIDSVGRWMTGSGFSGMKSG